jgi:hypothetical protein
VSAAGNRARARIRRNRRDFELLALSGAFGPIAEDDVDVDGELGALCGVDVDKLRATSAAAIAGDERDDEEVCNPPAGASWVDNRTTSIKRVRM